MRTPLGCLLAAAAIAVGAVPARAQLPVVKTHLDRGSYVIYSHDRVIGREDFSLGAAHDTLVLHSECSMGVEGGADEETATKQVDYVAKTPGWNLVVYDSRQTVRGKEYRVAAVPGTDTTVSVYHEVGVNGIGDVYLRPRGRLVVLDPMIYSMFQVAVAELPATDVDRRLGVLALASRDTVVEARLRSTGTETIRWEGKPVVARTLRFEQGGLAFELWVDPRGRLIRVAHPASGLRVERQSVALKPRRKPAG